MTLTSIEAHPHEACWLTGGWCGEGTSVGRGQPPSLYDHDRCGWMGWVSPSSTAKRRKMSAHSLMGLAHRAIVPQLCI